MRNIPTAMRLKLLNRIKAAANESEPSVRVIATQASRNTLLTEPIHEDIPAALGDVALQQTAGKTAIELAYAICLDDGVAKIYRRNFPAMMDYEWDYVWTFGNAEDVAIEFDGDWTMDGSKDWYYLVTEQYPYIFTVEGGDLYVQKWRDTSSRLKLAENVSSISACKGWHDYTNLDNDQGLIIGYIKGGEVYYRALAYSTVISDRVWENEHKVTDLGTGNSNLSVIRTNDFRIGFMTEKNGQIQMALTQRTYPGASVRPEYLAVGTNAYFSYLPIKYWYPQHNECAVCHTEKTFCLFDSIDDHRMQIVSAERILTEDAGGNSVCTGVIAYLDRPLIEHTTTRFKTGCSVSSEKISISNVTYDAAEQALIFSFSWNAGYPPNTHPAPFDITYPFCTEITYDALDGQIWYLDSGSIALPQMSMTYHTFENERLKMNTQATLTFVGIQYYYTYDRSNILMSTATEFSFVPVGDIPV